MAQERLSVRLVSPSRVVFEGPADSVVAPAWDGMLGILRGHAPLITLMGKGRLRVSADGDRESFRVSGGVLEVTDNEVTVLSEQIGEE